MLPRKSIWLALLLAIGLALGTLRKAQSLGSPDFKVFYTAAVHALEDPENIYRISPDRYLYPPSTAILLIPFAFTKNYVFQQWLWHGLLALILFALASRGWAALAACFLLLRYLAITFSYGQINLVVIGLLALAGQASSRAGWGRAGSLWALATSLKVYPAVLAPFFFPRERWRAYLSGAFAFFFVLLLPFLFFGQELGVRLYGEFLEALKDKGLPLHSHNQSLAALLHRLGTKQEFYLHAVGPAWWGLADLPTPLLKATAWLIGGSGAVYSWSRAWKRKLSPEASLAAAAFSLIFLSHIVWKDYLLFLYFPFLDGFSRWPRKKSFLVAGAFGLMITLSSPDLVGHPLSTRLDAACIHLWAAVLVWWAWCQK